jgi:biopolymer transport protein ExbD
MMTLKMIPSSGHVTKLPTSSTASQAPIPKLIVELTENDELIVESRKITTNQLTALLKSRDAVNTAVTLVGADSVALQNVMHVIDAVKVGGVTQIALAAKKNK